MVTIEEANSLLNNINTLNQKITQIDIQISEREKIINQVLASVQVNSIEELNAKIAACQQQLDMYYMQIKQEYDTVLPKVNEAETCLQN